MLNYIPAIIWIYDKFNRHIDLAFIIYFKGQLCPDNKIPIQVPLSDDAIRWYVYVDVYDTLNNMKLYQRGIYEAIEVFLYNF